MISATPDSLKAMTFHHLTVSPVPDRIVAKAKGAPVFVVFCVGARKTAPETTALALMPPSHLRRRAPRRRGQSRVESKSARQVRRLNSGDGI
jgi:hypothetical protein